MDNINDVLKKLDSGEPDQIEEAIQAIREKGDMGTAEVLLEHMKGIEDKHLLTVIVSLLADIKESAFREVLIRHMGNGTTPEIQCELLRIVWESALDYSPYLDIFIKLLENPDFALSFEASTLIENMVNHLSEEQLAHLEKVISSFPEDKQYLVENIEAEIEECRREIIETEDDGPFRKPFPSPTSL